MPVSQRISPVLKPMLLSAYRAKYNEDPDMFSAQYYDAVMIIAQAMEKAQSSDPKVFKDELAKLKDYPVSRNSHLPAGP